MGEGVGQGDGIDDQREDAHLCLIVWLVLT